MIVGVEIRPKLISVGFSRLGEHLDDVVSFKPPQTQRNLVPKIVQVVHENVGKNIEAICVVAPEVIDKQRGKLVAIKGLPYSNLRIQKPLNMQLGCPVVLEHTTSAALLCESSLEKNSVKLVYIDLSSNLGAAISKNTDSDQNCEYIDLGAQIVNFDDNQSEFFRDLLRDVFKKSNANNDYLKRLNKHQWNLVASYLSIGIYNLICLANPEHIVLGGDLSEFYKKFIKSLKKQLYNRNNAQLKISKTHFENPCLVGAIRLAANELL